MDCQLYVGGLCINYSSFFPNLPSKSTAFLAKGRKDTFLLAAANLSSSWTVRLLHTLSAKTKQKGRIDHIPRVLTYLVYEKRREPRLIEWLRHAQVFFVVSESAAASPAEAKSLVVACFNFGCSCRSFLGGGGGLHSIDT